MFLFAKKQIRFTAILLAIFFVGILVSGVVSQGLSLNQGDCLFDSSESCVGASAHFIEWQGSFTIFPGQDTLSLLALLLSSLGLILLITTPVNIRYTALAQYIHNIFIQIRSKLPIQLFNYFILLYSKGKLQPKLFNY